MDVGIMHRTVCLFMSQLSFCWYSLHLLMKGWPGWVDLGVITCYWYCCCCCCRSRFTRVMMRKMLKSYRRLHNYLTFSSASLFLSDNNNNQKSELMLMRRARAYGSSCLQLISVYLHPFHHTSLFCSQKSHKITRVFYFLSSRSSMLIPLTSTSPLLVMII